MIADTADYGELKTGRRVTGLVFSGVLFAIKLGIAIAGFCIGTVLAHMVTTEKLLSKHLVPARYLLAISLLPALGHFMLIPIVLFYRLSSRRCNEIRLELDALSAH